MKRGELGIESQQESAQGMVIPGCQIEGTVQIPWYEKCSNVGYYFNILPRQDF